MNFVSTPLGELYLAIINFVWNWWWVPAPFFLYSKLREYYLFWANWEFWSPVFKKSWTYVEIIPPKNLAKTFKTMEDVFSALWGALLTPPNWREFWLEGLPGHYGGPSWFFLEIVSLGGKIHFYARVPKGFKSHFEATIYAQYPDAEIVPAEDYTKKVPFNIPDEEWDIKGEDYMLNTDDPVPLKTYTQFFEPKMGKIDEERLIDPMHSLMEAMSQLKIGDQLWMQFGLIPIIGNEKEVDYFGYCKKVIDKLKGKAEKAPEPSVVQKQIGMIADTTPSRSVVSQFLGGPPIKLPEPKKEEEKRPDALSPGERSKLEAVEEKAAKRSYLCFIRAVYVFRKDLPHDSGTFGVPRNFFQHFAGYNSMRFFAGTRTKINYILRDRRLYLRKRKIFKNYIYGSPPIGGFHYFRRGPMFVLNIEELATLYHFPNQLDAPRVYQPTSKKGEPPVNLPME